MLKHLKWSICLSSVLWTSINTAGYLLSSRAKSHAYFFCMGFLKWIETNGLVTFILTQKFINTHIQYMPFQRTDESSLESNNCYLYVTRHDVQIRSDKKKKISIEWCDLSCDYSSSWKQACIWMQSIRCLVEDIFGALVPVHRRQWYFRV